MKKLILVVALLCVCATPVFAAPKLTADCSLATDNVTGADLQMDGVWTDIPVTQTCVGVAETVTCVAPSVTVCYDTLPIPNGAHTARLRWKNVWGVSADSLPLNFVKGGPSGSPTLRIK